MENNEIPDKKFPDWFINAFTRQANSTSQFDRMFDIDPETGKCVSKKSPEEFRRWQRDVRASLKNDDEYSRHCMDIGENKNSDNSSKILKKIYAKISKELLKKYTLTPKQKKKNMNEETLKKLVKIVLNEIYQLKHRSPSSAVHEGYIVQLDSVVIPNVCSYDDTVEVMVDIAYEGEKGEPARGMFGPPENSSPGYDDNVDIIEWIPTSIRVNEQQEFDPNKLTPEQQKPLDEALTLYIEQHRDEIEQEILENSGNSEDY